MQNLRYPKICIQSKNELAKHISHKGFFKDQSLRLINDVLANFDEYWKDSVHSEPEKEKYVRNAKRTPLGLLLQKINTMVLAPYDNLLPNFIFGGIKESNHVKAATYLLGKKRKRTLLKLDITRFFEQVSDVRVAHFFKDKCRCSKRASTLLTRICCVPVGPKGSTSYRKTIARGFATSSRLAVWCNLDTFIKLNHLVQQQLKGKDPRIAIYVDDIGITASHVAKDDMEKLGDDIRNLLLSTDPNQELPINEKKTRIISHEEGMEHLGLRLHRNKLAIGSKTLSKKDSLKSEIKKTTSPEGRSFIRRKIKSLYFYKRYIESS